MSLSVLFTSVIRRDKQVLGSSPFFAFKVVAEARIFILALENETVRKYTFLTTQTPADIELFRLLCPGPNDKKGDNNLRSCQQKSAVT